MIGGLLGVHFLSDYEILVDLPGGRLLVRELGPPAGWDGVELTEPTPVQVLHGTVLAVPAAMNGTEFFSLLDLASTPSIVSPAVTGKLAIADEGEATFRVGATELAGLPYRARDLEMFRRFDPAGNGFVIVGAPVAWKCPLMISWARSQIRTCVR